MADGPYRFQQPGTGQYYYPPHNHQVHHPRHLARNGSPVNRTGYSNETPSPSRSPVSQSVTHNPFTMFNQGHQQAQHSMMNGGNGHQRYMQMNVQQHKYQHQNHQQHHGQQNHHHQQNLNGHLVHGQMNHQHTFSSGMTANSTPNFTPSGLHNGTTSENHDDLGEPFPEHWQAQLQRVQELRQSSSMPHRHSKKEGAGRVSRINMPISEETDREGQLIERNRAVIRHDTRRQDWDGMDLSGQGLRNLSMGIFHNYDFLDKLFIDSNKLTSLPPAISRLRNLSILDASNNELRELPDAIGMLVNLKGLYVFDNHIITLPCEIGYLYRLNMLGIEGNPLEEELKEMIVRHGTKALVVHIRDNTEAGPPPMERETIIVDDSEASEVISVLDFNILCDKYATAIQYGYTPTRALSWDYRRELILEELKKREPDFICMQEVDTDANDFFRRELAYHRYKGFYSPRSRARTMAEKEARLVDGCANFYNAQKFIMLDKAVIDFANIAINRPDMKGEHDIFNRVMPRDYIAVVTFFENRNTGSRIIVANTHLFWDPVYADVKIVQVAILMEQITKLADRWANTPPCTDKKVFPYSDPDSESDPEIPVDPPVELGASLEYATGSQIPLVLCGDFNSVKGTGVYDFLDRGSLPGDHEDLSGRSYGNFTRDGTAHPFNLKSAYGDRIDFTNYTPDYSGVLDYIWHTTNSLKLRKLLGEVDDLYLQKVPGFPTFHFPSDHLMLWAEFSVEAKKERPKPVEADFGPQRERRN